MAEYEVTLPISGYTFLTVEAESEEEAIEAALLQGVASSDIEAWETMKEVVRGNVWRGVGSPRASAERIDD